MIEAVSLQGKKEETSLVSAGSYVIGNTSLDFQRGTDRQMLRTHGPLNADFIVKVKQRKEDRPLFLAACFLLLTYIFNWRYNIDKSVCCITF